MTSVLILGAVYILVAVLHQFRDLGIGPWLDAYFTAGSAVAGAALSVILTLSNSSRNRSIT